MAQPPAIPVQHTIKSTYRAISKLNGDELPKLRRVKRPELENRVALYNTFSRGVLNSTLSFWFKQHSNVMENLRKEQVQIFKTMCRMQRLKRRVQKDEHERRCEEIRKMFRRQRKRHLMRKVVQKFKENVIRKRRERFVENSQDCEGPGISAESLLKFAGGFRRMTEPTVGTGRQTEVEETLQKETKESIESKTTTPKLPPLTPNSGSLTTSAKPKNDSICENENASLISEQKTTKTTSEPQSDPTLVGQKANQHRNTVSKSKYPRKRRETLHSIPEVGVLDESDLDKQNEITATGLSSPSTNSLPPDLSKLNTKDSVMSRRGSLPSKYKQAECVSAHSSTLGKHSDTTGQSRSQSKDNSPLPPAEDEIHALGRSGNQFQIDEVTLNEVSSKSVNSNNMQPIHDHAITRVAEANERIEYSDSSHQSSEHRIKSQLSHNEEWVTSGANSFSHNSFYAQIPTAQIRKKTTGQCSHSAHATIREPFYDNTDTENQNEVLTQQTPSQSPSQMSQKSSNQGQPSEENGRNVKHKKTNMVKQMRAEQALRAKMRSNVLDKEPVTRYTKRGHSNVTPMYGLPKRMEFNPPTRKLQHEHEKMLRGVHDMEVQNQIKIDSFFEDLFQTKDDSTKVQRVKSNEDEKPKKPTLTLAGVLSQMYSAKDNQTTNKNSFEWLKKCQYLRVYNPWDRQEKGRSLEQKRSSWDEAEKKLKAGFLALNFMKNS